MYLKKQVVFLEVHLRVVFLGGNGELDLQAVENGGERTQVRHQAGNIVSVNCYFQCSEKYRATKCSTCTWTAVSR